MFLGALIGALLVLPIAAFIALWQFLAPVDRTVFTSYNDFMEDVHQGRVAAVYIRGSNIDYDLLPAPQTGHAPPPVRKRHAINPSPFPTDPSALKPTNPALPAPKIYIDK